MKLRTSYFNKTIFKKDITRFAPAWGLYAICLLLGMLLMRQNTSAYGYHQNLSQLLPIMGVINCGYALLASQLLFGDLYNSRMCNTIHALPVTREGLFVSHTAAGLFWSVVPTTIAALLGLLLGIGSTVEQGWQLVFWWLLGTNLQYLFYFGLGAFCALCVGNRFAQAVVYGITNFASIIAFWLVDTLYTPMLYGIHTKEDPFMLLSPALIFTESEYLDVERIWDADKEVTIRAWFEIGDGWGYLAICACLGVALLVAACLLYRKRQLECAGDFMAVKALEPVFLVVFPLIVAAVFHFFCDEMLYMGGFALLYLVVGLGIGFFTGLMLLERTIRIFSKRAFLKFAALAAGFLLTLGVVALDPLGIVTWIPDEEDVVKVEISPSQGNYEYLYSVITLEDPQEIADALRVHEIALEHRDFEEYGYGYIVTETGAEYHVNNQTISIHYTLKNGTTKSRYYVIDLYGEAGEILIPYYNTMEAIFDDWDELEVYLNGDFSIDNLLNHTLQVTVRCDGYYDVDNMDITDRMEIRQLLEAIAADAELGVMAQNWNFRPDPDVSSCYWLEFDYGNYGDSVTIYADCVNTIQWLTDHGFFSYTLQEQYGIARSYGEETVAELGGVTVDFETE